MFFDNIHFFNANDGVVVGEQIDHSNSSQAYMVVLTTGTFFTFDLAYVPGTISTYISTGGDTANNVLISAGALHGIGSSYSTDDGNSWITIDTAVDHLAIDMVNPTTGFCGGFNTT